MMETGDLTGAVEELLANSAPDVVFEPHAAHGQEIRGHEELRRFWSDFVEQGLEIRVGVYSIAEEGATVVVNGWVRTIDEGRLADSQARWVYRFDEKDRVVSARIDRG